ncbi:MAG: substrate-binding domain-containing protein [Planctomycetes bacterium]|nr:substrate-binding domain-containing protein [Planctomycetota bacterium]
MAKAAARRPHIGLLYWLDQKMESTFCREVFKPFLEQATAGKLTYEFLHPSRQTQARDPYPPLELVKAARFDGLVSVSIWKEPYLGELAKLGKPVVTLDFRSIACAFDSVTFGNRPAFRQIGKILKDTGHKDVLFVSLFRPDRNSKPGLENFIEDDTSLERRTALQEACADLGIEVWPLLPVYTGSGNRRKQVSTHLPELIANMGHPPSAISGHDTDAISNAMEAVAALNLKVPRDLSMITVGSESDDASIAKRIPMDMIVFSWRHMGEEGLRLLMERLGGKVPADRPPRHVELSGQYAPLGTVIERRPKKD